MGKDLVCLKKVCLLLPSSIIKSWRGTLEEDKTEDGVNAEDVLVSTSISSSTSSTILASLWREIELVDESIGTT